MAAAVALWLVVVPTTAGAVEAGFDLLETDPATTQYRFSAAPIPASFFDPGSAAFTGEVSFGGIPLETFQGKDVGDADTIIERAQPFNLVAPFPAMDTRPIEIVALSLHSVQPITVQVGTTTQLWDVRVALSPTTPSHGQMTITKTSDQGGTFSSQLLVMPLFTFTRLSDGATRTIDVGQLRFDQQTLGNLILTSSNVPWRAGCVPPALAVSRLNDGFCPGLTVEGFKQPFVEESQLAKHGVLPAQPQLEHFKCYKIRPRQAVKQRRVQLADQFGASSARVLAPLSLCAPAQKNQERFVNDTAHLECYAIRQTPAFRARTVAVHNQFGSDILDVTKPTSLCAPSLKTPAKQRKPPPLPPAEQIDHFTCYRVSSQAQAPPRQVSVTDQFGSERLMVLQPVNLCAPVQKNAAQVQHPVGHLVCYKVKDLSTTKFRPQAVRVSNQFGSQAVTVVKPRLLCAPSVKVAL